jgi:hypothetical protein
MTGQKPRILDVDRFADGCWATVTDLVFGGSSIQDETVFYHRYVQKRWQLNDITIKLLNESGIVIDEIEAKRDLD